MRLAMPGSPNNSGLYKITPSKGKLYTTTRTNITPQPALRKNTTSAEDYKAARKAMAARAKTKAKPAPKKTSAASGGSLSGGFGGSDLGSFSGGGGGTGSYLDVFNQGGGGDDKTFADYMADANKIYKPSLDYLNQQKTEATTRAAQQDKFVAQLYDSLVRGIRAQTPIIGHRYDSAIDTQTGITSGAKQAVGDNYQRSQQQQVDMLKQLGIEAAAPETLQTGQDSQAFFQSLLDNSGAANNSFLNSQKVASQDFNTAQANISAQQGVDARFQNQRDLSDLLGQLSGKGADLQTQINQQAASMQSGAAQAMLDQQKAMIDAMYKQNQTNIDLSKLGLSQASLELDRQKAAQGDENAKARLELDQAKFKATPPKAAPAPKIPSNPWGNAMTIAQQLYGNGSSAQNAIQAIQDAIRTFGTHGPTSAGELLTKVLQRVSPSGKPTGGGDTSSLTSLVDYLYKQLYK